MTVANQESLSVKGKKISFLFQPDIQKDKYYCEERVFKSDDGVETKRKYVKGLSSGIKIDKHGERMTENCIKSFMAQANSGDILLYPDIHGIKSSEDIGILEKAEIQPDGDWFTEYRLYDSLDGVGPHKMEIVDTIWKQLNGIAPYRKPRQKGFSIEGYIPDGAIIDGVANSFGGITKRVINDVLLDGVCLVPRPAYETGIANALYKALGEVGPWKMDKLSIRNTLRDKLQKDNIRDQYYRKKYDVANALEEMIERAMKDATIENKAMVLEDLFDEFKEIMIDLIIQSSDLFNETAEVEAGIQPLVMAGADIKTSKLEVYKSLMIQLQNLKRSIKNSKGGNYNA